MSPPRKEDDSRRVVVTDPDPSWAAQEALSLAIKNLGEKVDLRFLANDQATMLAKEELKDKLLALQNTITDAAKALQEANKELVGQLGLANQSALAAALLTQKEFIEQLRKNVETANSATNEKIDRLTSRMDTGVDWRGGVDASRSDYRADRRDTTQAAVDHRNYIIAAIGVAVAIAAFFGFGLHR